MCSHERKAAGTITSHGFPCSRVAAPSQSVRRQAAGLLAAVELACQGPRHCHRNGDDKREEKDEQEKEGEGVASDVLEYVEPKAVYGGAVRQLGVVDGHGTGKRRTARVCRRARLV